MPNSEKTFTHYLNGSVIPEPGGFADFSEELIRDYDQKIISTKYPLDLVFTEGNYDVLRTLFLSGYCAVATYAATTTCDGEEFDCVRGTIKLGDVQWNLNKCSAQVPVADDGYGARIANNSTIEATPAATSTKNGLDLTPVTPIGIMYYASTGGALGVRSSYDWLECMNHIVRLITDNEVIVESAWYDDLPNDERYSIVYGLEMRTATGTTPAPRISYGKLYDELAKKYNLLGAIVRNTYGAPVFKIEPESYWNGDPDAPIHYIYNQDDLIQSVDSERLYASMRLGSKVFIKDQTNQFPYPFLNIRSFTDEVVNIVGTCNTDAQLDLTSEWIIDTNVIYDSIENGNDEYDDDIFLVQYNPVSFEATMGRYLVPLSDPLLYNEQLLNINVANRYDLQGNLAQYIGPQDISFRAAYTNTPVTNQVYDFVLPNSNGVEYTSTRYVFKYDNDYTSPNYDTGNAWGNGTAQGSPVTQANSRYTTTVQGFFELHEHTRWTVNKTAFSYGASSDLDSVVEERTLRLEVERYDVGNALIATYTYDDMRTGGVSINNTVHVYDSDFYMQIPLDAGDYLIVNKVYIFKTSGGDGTYLVSSQTNQFRAITPSYIETSFIATGGGVIEGDPDNYRAVVHEFDRHLTDGVWNQIKDAPESNIVVSTGDQPMYPGVPYIISRNVSTGKTTWKLLSTFADIQ
jgi:hypothetical protein